MNSSRDLAAELSVLLAGTLNLGVNCPEFHSSTPLLGAIPELDSIGVATLIGEFEEHFDIAIDDAEIDSAVFLTFGSLLAFLAIKAGH